MTKLKADAGTTEVNVGETDYVVPADGIIDVPADAVDDLIARGGFELAEDAPVVPDGLAVMKAPDAGASCSFGGVAYTADAKGLVSVPVAAVAALESHGFVLEAG